MDGCHQGKARGSYGSNGSNRWETASTGAVLTMSRWQDISQMSWLSRSEKIESAKEDWQTQTQNIESIEIWYADVDANISFPKLSRVPFVSTFVAPMYLKFAFAEQGGIQWARYLLFKKEKRLILKERLGFNAIIQKPYVLDEHVRADCIQ